MNQFFEIKRFSLLVLKHWADNKKRYNLSILAYVGLLITWFLFTMFVDRKAMPEDLQLGTFFFSLFVVGTFYASQYFSDLGSRDRGSHFILVPASTFEKLVCSLVFTVILFPLVFITFFYLVDIIMLAFANSFYGNSNSTVVNVFRVNFIRFNSNQAIKLFLFFFSIESLFLLGSVYFKKYNFIKTIITGFVIFFLCFLFVYIMAEHVLPEREDDYYFSKIEKWFPTFLQVLAYTIAPIAWVVSYFVLKAKQV